MYEKCLDCKKLGNPCDGPNFMAMNTEDLIHWCNERKKQLPGLTYDRIVEQTGLSKGTVSAFFKGTHSDYRIDTIRPILKLLVGGEWEDSPCGDPTAEERHQYEEKLRQLEDGIAWRDDKIKHLTQQNEDLLKQKEAMQTLITNTNKRHDDTKTSYDTELASLWKEIKRKNKTILALAIPLVICLLVIIAALVIDYVNRSIGFLWLESLLKPHGINEMLQQWRT